MTRLRGRKNMQDQLWTGGAWEQSQPDAVPAPAVVSRKRKRGRWPLAMAAIAAIFFFGALLFSGVLMIRVALNAAAGEEQEGPTSAPTMPRAPVGGTARLALEEKAEQILPLQEIYQRTIPSVVYIVTRTDGGVSAGSGVIMSEDGYVLTNYHVLEGASEARVILSDNRAMKAALVGGHETCDLAVLKVEAGDLIPARFATSADVQVGDGVVAIGNPLGQRLRGTMTEGIVSAVDRSVTTDGVSVFMLQTSAALNPGNSGGVLVNDRGQVIGITTMKMVSRQQNIEGLGFAIPTRLAKGLVNQIIATGEAKLPALGVTLAPENGEGLRVVSVHEISDAKAKGLRPGDILTHANGIPLPEIGVLAGIKQELGVGDDIELTVRRKDQTFSLSVTLIDEASVK